MKFSSKLAEGKRVTLVDMEKRVPRSLYSSLRTAYNHAQSSAFDGGSSEDYEARAHEAGINAAWNFAAGRIVNLVHKDEALDTAYEAFAELLNSIGV